MGNFELKATKSEYICIYEEMWEILNKLMREIENKGNK